MGAVAPGLDVRQPLQNSTGVTSNSAEIAGPQSVVKVRIPGGLAPAFVTDGLALNRARIEGLDFSGAVVSSLAISETILEAPAYDNASGNEFSLEFSASAGLEAFFNNDDVALVRIRVTTSDRDPVTDGVETAFNSDSEAEDECLFADNDAPQLTAAYRGDDDILYLVFNEPMANGNSDNSENQTNQQFVNATDIQVNVQNIFDASTPTIAGGLTLISGFADGVGRMILMYQLNPESTPAVGSYVRMAADDFGNPTHNVYRDVSGNDGFQQGEPGSPTQEGVEVLGGAPPNVGGSHLWAPSGFGTADFNASASWVPNAAPTYEKDLRMNIAPAGFAFVEFSQGVTAAQSLWTDGFISMSVGNSINNPNGVLYLHGQESFAGVFTTAFLLRDAFATEPSPTASFSIDQGVIDAESMAFRQDFGGSISCVVLNDGEIRTGSLRIGEPDGSAFMQAVASSGGRLITGFDNGIGARTTQVPSVIADRSGTISVVAGGEWLSLGDIDVNSGGQIVVSVDARAEFHGDVNLNAESLFFNQNTFITNQADAKSFGSYILNDVNFNDGLMYCEKLTVEGGREFEAPEFTVGLFGPKFAGVAVYDQLVVRSGSRVGASNLFSVAYDGRVFLPDFDGNSPLPVDETQANIVLDGGTLELRFAEGFDPPLGSEFPLISGKGFSGRFSNHILPSFDDGRVAIVTYPIPRTGNGKAFFEGATLRIVDLESLLGFVPDPAVTDIGEAPVKAAAGDLDGDDDLDVAVIFDSGEGSGSVMVLRNRGSVEGVWQGFEKGVQFQTGPKPMAIAIGDFTNETPKPGVSDQDIAVVCAGDNSLRVYLNTGSGSAFEAIASIETAAFPTDVDAEDFNNDGFTDLAVVCRDADLIQIFLNNGGEAAVLGGIFQAPRNVETDDEPVDLDPVDLDNDKDIDLATGTAGGVSTSSNDGKGGFGMANQSQAGGPADAVATGDLDRDGDADGAIATRSTGLLSIFINNGNAALDFFSSFSVGADAGALAIEDYDEDGDADISVVSIPEGDTLHRVTILRNDTQDGGPLVFTPIVELTNRSQPSDPKVVYSVDVDGDGRPDIVTVDDQVGREGGVVSSYLNVSGPLPVCAGDVNKDRRVDGKDLQIVLSMFGQLEEPFTGANFNGDTFVDGRDLSVLLSNYGAECDVPTAIP